MIKPLAITLVILIATSATAQTVKQAANAAKDVVTYEEKLQSVADIITATTESGQNEEAHTTCLAALGLLQPSLAALSLRLSPVADARDAAVDECVKLFCMAKPVPQPNNQHAYSQHCQAQ